MEVNASMPDMLLFTVTLCTLAACYSGRSNTRVFAMQQRKQTRCSQCDEVTLHEMDPPSVNHILHLLLSMTVCWIPIWILLIVTAPRRYMRCATCGQIPGKLSPREAEENAAYKAKKAADRRAAMGQAASAAGQMAGSAAAATGRAAGSAAKATGRAAAAGMAAGASGAVAAFAAGKVAAIQMAGQIDRAIRSLAGDDVFMVWMCRGLVLLAMLVAGGGALYTVWRVLFAK